MGSFIRDWFRGNFSKTTLYVFCFYLLFIPNTFSSQVWDYALVTEVGNACYASFRENQVAGRALATQIFITPPSNNVKKISLYGYDRNSTYELGKEATQQYLNQTIYNFHVFKKIFNRRDDLNQKLSNGNHQLKSAVQVASQIFDEQKAFIRTLVTSKDLSNEVQIINQWNGEINQICKRRNATFRKLMNAYQNRAYQNSQINPEIESLLYPAGKSSVVHEALDIQSLLKRRMDEERENGNIESGFFQTLVANSSLATLLETETDLQKQVGLFNPLGCVEDGTQLGMIPDLGLIPNSIKQVEKKYVTTIEKLAPQKTLWYLTKSFFYTPAIEDIVQDYAEHSPVSIRNALLLNPDPNQARAACTAIRKVQSSIETKQVVLPIFRIGTTLIASTAAPEATPLLGFLFGLFNVGIDIFDLANSHGMEKAIEQSILSGQIESIQGQEVIRNIRNSRAMSYVNLGLSVTGTAMASAKMIQIKSWNARINSLGGSTTTYDPSQWKNLWSKPTPRAPSPAGKVSAKISSGSSNSTKSTSMVPGTIHPSTSSLQTWMNQVQKNVSLSKIQNLYISPHLSPMEDASIKTIESDSKKSDQELRIEEYKTKLDRALIMIGQNGVFQEELRDQVCFLLKFGVEKIKSKIRKQYPKLNCGMSGSYYSFNYSGFKNDNVRTYQNIFADPEYNVMLIPRTKSEEKIKQIASIYNKIWFVDDPRAEDKPLLETFRSYVFKHSFNVKVYSEKNVSEYEKKYTPGLSILSLVQIESNKPSLNQNLELIPQWRSLKIDLMGNLYLLCKDSHQNSFLVFFARPEIMDGKQFKILSLAIDSKKIDPKITRYVYMWAADLYWRSKDPQPLQIIQNEIWKIIYSTYQFNKFYMIVARQTAQREHFLAQLEGSLHGNLKYLDFTAQEIDIIISTLKDVGIFNTIYFNEKSFADTEPADEKDVNENLSDEIKTLWLDDPQLLVRDLSNDFNFNEHLRAYNIAAGRYWSDMFMQQASLKDKIHLGQVIHRLAHDKPIRLWYFFHIMAKEAYSSDSIRIIQEFIRSNGEIIQTPAEDNDLKFSHKLYLRGKSVGGAFDNLIREVFERIIHPINDDPKDDFNFLFFGEMTQISRTQYLVMDLNPYPQNFVIDISLARFITEDKQIIWIPSLNLENGLTVYYEIDLSAKLVSRVDFLNQHQLMDHPGTIYQNLRTVVATGQQFSIEKFRDDATKKFGVVTVDQAFPATKQFDSSINHYVNQDSKDKYFYIFIDTEAPGIANTFMEDEVLMIPAFSKFQVVLEKIAGKLHYIVLRQIMPVNDVLPSQQN